MKSETESIEAEFKTLIDTLEAEMNKRGVLMLDHAQHLLQAIKRAKAGIAKVEAVMPRDFFSSTWNDYRKTFDQFETRLTRIIRGTTIPLEDNER